MSSYSSSRRDYLESSIRRSRQKKMFHDASSLFIKFFTQTFKSKSIALLTNKKVSQMTRRVTVDPNLFSKKNIIDLKFKNHKNKYDLVIGDLPFEIDLFSFPKNYDEFRKQEKFDVPLEILKKTFNITNPDGFIIIFSYEFYIRKNAEFMKEDDSFSLNAIIRFPKFIEVQMGMRVPPSTNQSLCAFIFSQNKTKNIFLGEIDKRSQVELLISNFYYKKNTKKLSSGLLLNKQDFVSQEHHSINEKIKKLQSSYKNFNALKFADICVSINQVKSGSNFEHIENSIYISTYLSSRRKIYCEIQGIGDQHDLFVQLVLNSKIVINDYVQIFLYSNYGQLLGRLDAISRDQTNIKDLIIPIPSIKVQKQIIKNHEKLFTIMEKIDIYSRKMRSSPLDKSTEKKLNDLISIVDQLDIADRVKQQIDNGEDLTTEFKETFNLDLKTKQRSDTNYLVFESFRTIVGFCNTNGGTLIYGVTDKTTDIVGINRELHQFHENNRDHFKRYFGEFLKRKIENKFLEFIKFQFVEIDEKLLFVVDCEKVPPPEVVYLLDYKGENRCYRRIDPRTEELRGKDLGDFILSRMKFD